MIKKLISSFNVLVRVLKNLIMRPFRTLLIRIRSLFNVSRLTTKMPGAAQKIPSILKTRPERREDYFDWGSVYVAKKLVLIIALLLTAIPLLIIFVIIPLFTGWFGVKSFVIGDDAMKKYNGRVKVYYSSTYKELWLEGRLKDGVITEYGEEYYENGRPKYAGNFSANEYDGQGTLYYEDGSVKYKGELLMGVYNGAGELTGEDGTVRSGAFENGVMQGRGKITANGRLYYEGGFVDGEMSGDGKLYYPSGAVNYSGSFRSGQPDGEAIEYYEDGSVKYSGGFSAGKYNGSGILYDTDGTRLYSGGFETGSYNGTGTLYGKNGAKLYSGGFEMGEYSDRGTLYDDSGRKLYSGGFEEGLYSGTGTLYGENCVISGEFEKGSVSGAAKCVFNNGMTYEGFFTNNVMNGSGTLSDRPNNFSYSGTFADNDIDYGSVIGTDAASVSELFDDSLSRTDGEDCFYYINSRCRFALKCDYAKEGSPAQVKEIGTVPLTGSVKISGAEDIAAPSAISVSECSRVFPSWARRALDVRVGNASCYRAEYNDCVVFFWVSGGELIFKSAVSVSDPYAGALTGSSGDAQGGGAGADGAGFGGADGYSGYGDYDGYGDFYEAGGYGGSAAGGAGNGYGAGGGVHVDTSELEELFEEFGLDIEDYRSLGF